MKNVSVWWTLLLEQHSAGNCVSKLTYFGVKVDPKVKQNVITIDANSTTVDEHCKVFM